MRHVSPVSRLLGTSVFVLWHLPPLLTQVQSFRSAPTLIRTKFHASCRTSTVFLDVAGDDNIVMETAESVDEGLGGGRLGDVAETATLGRREAVSRACASAAASAAAVLSVASSSRLQSASAASADDVGNSPPASGGGQPTAGTSDAKKTTGTPEGGYKVLTTRSGLKFIDLREGTGPTPKFGQLISIGYKGYVKVATGGGSDDDGSSKSRDPPPMFDRDPAYLIKHGNGKIIPGLDEGIHTMKVGGLRRIIIPPKLGYVESGLGPVPEDFVGRFKLNSLLDKMVEARGGQVIFDVELLSAFDDEADQGYYRDESVAPEDFEKLKTTLQKSAAEARASGNVGLGQEEI